MGISGWARRLVALAWVAAATAAAQDVCSAPATCAEGAVCLRAVGQCGGEGSCVSDDFLCPDIYAPACGCDGHSYVSPCEAQRRGGGAARHGACCVGSCSTRDQVTENDLRLGIEEGLGGVKILACRSFDRDQSAKVTIDELVTAVGNALRGCR